MVNNFHRQMKDEEARHIATMEAFKVAKKKIQELNVKLTKAEREKRASRLLYKGSKSK